MPKIKIDWKIKNIGPHTDLKSNDNINSLKIGVYADNGLGKTFISRAYRLASPLYDPKSINNILTTNRTTGQFSFKIENPDDPVKPSRNLEIKLIKDSKANIINDTDYLFHVFNSDYVTENLAKHNYRPNDDIEGYILGKQNIDVTKENKEKEKLLTKQKLLHEKIEDAVIEAKSDLDILKIQKTLTEYKNINFENLFKDLNIDENESFDRLKDEYQQLKSMPDGMKDISFINYNISISLLEKVKKLLSKSFVRSQKLPKNFMDDVKSKLNFVELGIDLLDSDDTHCPFCKQKLNKTAIKIIEQYNQYIHDEEAQTTKKINTLIKDLEQLKLEIKEYYNKFNKKFIEFEDINNYLPSAKKFDLPRLPDAKLDLLNIDKLIKMLNDKKTDITSTTFDFDKPIIDIIKFLKLIGDTSKIQNKVIEDLNKVKNSINDEKLQLRRRLCNSKFLKVLNEQKSNVQKSKNLASEIVQLNETIREKENKSKIDRKQKVIESLNYFLEYFFDDKYKFDKNDYSIKFMDENLSDKATHVLSDGEKGIVAFCYYLATVHTIIENEDDYKRLFFVIDDPISSMDFHFVYRVAQSLRKINKHFDLESNDRFIILTHNLEFMNLLMRNNIINQKYILEENQIIKWKKQLILPYQSHLSDIIKTSEGIKPPAHTTPNSIRHVLETVSKFEHLDKNLEKYISENEKLNENNHIYSIIQDLSHGGPRSQPPITQQDIIEACKIVKDFIQEKYPGHIEVSNQF